MGMYLYRVTARRVKCSDGKEANVAKYAYKPHGWDDRFNRQMDFRTGCPAARRLAAEGKLTDRVVFEYDGGYIGVHVYGNPHNWGTFLDDCNLGTPRMPRLPVTCNVNPPKGE